MPRSRRIDPDVPEEETEDAAPTTRRRRADAAEDAAPVRRRPAEEDVEDDDEDEEEAPAASAPRRRRAAPAAKEEPAKPVRRSRAAAKDEDEDSDDDAAVIPISRGRKAIAKDRPVSEASLAYFRWTEDPQLIKFLTNEPWGYTQHWVTRDGKQSFPCMGKGCPLCAIGAKVNQKIVYPILNLTPAGADEFLVQSLEVGPQLDDTLVSHDASPKTGPLDRLWWAVSRTEASGSKSSRKKYNYVFTPVKDRDLADDWEVDLDEAEDAADAAEIPEPKTVIGEVTRAQLQEIADEVMGR